MAPKGISTAHPSHLVTLYDYQPVIGGVPEDERLEFVPPDIENLQLPFKRGEVLRVESEKLDWWILCVSSTSGDKGYVPTVLCAPVTINAKMEEKNGENDEAENELYNMTYFPNAPTPNVKNVCPEVTSNIFSRITIWWMTSLIVTGFRRTYTDSDVWDLQKRYESTPLYENFQKQWERETVKWKRSLTSSPDSGDTETDGKNLYKPSITKSIIREYGCRYLILLISKILADACQFVQAFLVRKLLEFIKEGDQDDKWGYIYAVLMLVVGLIMTICTHQHFQGARILGMEVKGALSAAIYRKMIVLNAVGQRRFTEGEMVNMMAVDVFKVQEAIGIMSFGVTAPLQLAASLAFLYELFGWSTFVGFAFLLLFVGLSMAAGKYQKKIKSREMIYKDQRLKLLNELLGGIRVVKLYAWEESFMAAIRKFRRKELHILLKSSIFKSVITFVFAFTPFLVSLVTFAVFVTVGNQLTAEVAFTGLTLFNVLKFPLVVMPMVVLAVMDASVAVKRIAKILKAEELDDTDVTKDDNIETAENSIEIINGEYTWNKKEDSVMRDINLKVPKGQLVAIVGPVGCGKSSFVSALLGEILKVSGNVQICGKIAYVAQIPWIQNNTLKENILFNDSYNKEKYESVIYSCSLNADLANFTKGDETEIGEKGINLSGGQKQRVALARAVYNNADVYILDDPLSAVDAHVGNHIFNYVIGNEGLLKEKTRIFVTHNLSYLPKVDQIVVLKDNRIAEVGTYDELVENDGNFAEFLRMYANNAEGENEETSNNESLEQNESNDELKDIVLSPDVLSKKCTENRKVTDILAAHKKMEKRKQSHSGDIIKQETTEVGNIKVKVLAMYLKSLGVIATVLSVLFAIATHGCAAGTRLWLAKWSTMSNTTDSERDFLIGIYGAFGAGQVFSLLLFTAILSVGSISAARILHRKMVGVILRCPMSMFDTTPLGRIINIFSKDINVVDEVLPKTMSSVLGHLMEIISVIVMISYATPIILAALVPIAIVYSFVQRFYVASSRQLKRIESVRRSPIFNHFLESIHGSSTIRAFACQERFINENASKLDFNQASYFASFTSNRWLSIRLETCANLLVFFTSLFLVVQHKNISEGIAGVALTYALEVTMILNLMVRMASEMEVNIVSVERAKEYLELEPEAAWETESGEEKSWPSAGVVSFENYSTRYREGLDLALDNITFSTKESEKVGIVGRTGAGKSSVTLALFRIIEPVGGKICIDGVDITTLGLKELRSKISIIPQDPVLFSGTIRFNLDPFCLRSDADVWEALEVAHLKAFVAERKEGLNYEVEGGGTNLSVGQRQLVCLARALLRKSKILVLDEATAAVDMETDAFIQETIQREFKDCTILTIAHRLNTILEYDRILVLDQGGIVEFDTPNNLLEIEDGIFRNMVKDAGLLDQSSIKQIT